MFVFKHISAQCKKSKIISVKHHDQVVYKCRNYFSVSSIYLPKCCIWSSWKNGWNFSIFWLKTNHRLLLKITWLELDNLLFCPQWRIKIHNISYFSIVKLKNHRGDFKLTFQTQIMWLVAFWLPKFPFW